MFRLMFLAGCLSGVLAAEALDIPAQAGRGRAIFLDAEKANHCATCHQLGKDGKAIGPDLTKIARLSPKAIVVSILASRTVYAQEVTLKARRKFPAMVASDKDGTVKLFDLSKAPPEELTMERSAIYSIKDNASWKHPPESTGYKAEQLADVIAYIRFVAYGDTKGVDPSEVK